MQGGPLALLNCSYLLQGAIDRHPCGDIVSAQGHGGVYTLMAYVSIPWRGADHQGSRDDQGNTL
jgi:hypothetical protein